MVEFASEAIHPPWGSVASVQGAKALYTIGSETASARETFEGMRSRNVVTAVDVDFAEIDSDAALRDLLRVTTILFCNGETARSLSSKRSAIDSARSLSTLGPRAVVVTLGSQGALVFDRERGSATAQGHAVDVVDSTGAGDCFAGSFLFAWIRAWPLAAALEIANAMAAISTTAYGCQAGVPTSEELLASPLARDAAFRSLLAA